MYSPWKITRQFRLWLVFSVSWFEFGKPAETVDSKCAKERPNLFENCDVDYNFMAMWCDHTNFTELPHPEHARVKTQTHASKVKVIHLNDSCITHLDPDVLKEYPRLLTFNCDDNELTSIVPNTFSKNSQMTQLTLSKNWISNLSNNAFVGLKHLQVLSLNDNFIEVINDQVLSSLTSLLTLNLSNNKLRIIQEKAFFKLRSLEELNLSQNQLMSVSTNHFRPFAQLRILNLNENNLTEIGDATFLTNSNLQSLDLSQNNISYLPENAFNTNKKLSILKLNGNMLTTPKSRWVSLLLTNSNPKMLNDFLSNNPWTCNCKSCPYWTFLNRLATAKDWKKILDVYCLTPHSVAESWLSSLSLPDQCRADECRESNVTNNLLLAAVYEDTQNKGLDNEEQNTLKSDDYYNEIFFSSLFLNKTEISPQAKKHSKAIKGQIIILISSLLGIVILALILIRIFRKSRKRSVCRPESRESFTLLKESLHPHTFNIGTNDVISTEQETTQKEDSHHSFAVSSLKNDEDWVYETILDSKQDDLNRDNNNTHSLQSGNLILFSSGYLNVIK